MNTFHGYHAYSEVLTAATAAEVTLMGQNNPCFYSDITCNSAFYLLHGGELSPKGFQSNIHKAVKF